MKKISLILTIAITLYGSIFTMEPEISSTLPEKRQSVTINFFNDTSTFEIFPNDLAFLKKSITISDMLDDLQDTAQENITLFLSQDIFVNTIIPLLKTDDSITQKTILAPKTVPELTALINALNYLNIPSLLDLAVTECAGKMQTPEFLETFQHNQYCIAQLEIPSDMQKLLVDRLKTSHALIKTMLSKESVRFNNHTKNVKSIAFSPKEISLLALHRTIPSASMIALILRMLPLLKSSTIIQIVSTPLPSAPRKPPCLRIG